MRASAGNGASCASVGGGRALQTVLVDSNNIDNNNNNNNAINWSPARLGGSVLPAVGGDKYMHVVGVSLVGSGGGALIDPFYERHREREAQLSRRDRISSCWSPKAQANLAHPSPSSSTSHSHHIQPSGQQPPSGSPAEPFTFITSAGPSSLVVVVLVVDWPSRKSAGRSIIAPNP